MAFLSLVDSIDKLLQKLLIVLMAVLLIDVSWQVLTRFILANPSSFTEELARFLLIWIGLLGSAHAYRHKMHLGVDIFVKSLSTTSAKVLKQAVQLITIAFALSVLVFGGGKLMLLAIHLNQESPAMHINMGVIYIALPLSGILLALFAIEHMLTPDTEINNEVVDVKIDSKEAI